VDLVHRSAQEGTEGLDHDLVHGSAQKGTEGLDDELARALVTPPNYPHADLTDKILGATIEVHRQLGSGFLEKVYENALCVELRARRLEFVAQAEIPVVYKKLVVGTYYADLLVASAVICEVKALSALTTVHQSQLLHYLKATGFKVGLLLNFGTPKIQIKRLVF